MKVKKFVVGYLSTNCYLAYDEESKNAFLVDPCRGFVKIKSFIEENQLNLQGILITHGHIDHIEEAKKWQDEGQKIYIGEYDAEKLDSDEKCLANLIKMRFNKIVPDVLLKDGDKIDLGGISVEVMFTPGHTQGGVCYILKDCIFSGDTLFKDSYGRYDFYDGDLENLQNSLKKLFALDGDYKIYCGHGEDTTLEHERKNNPILIDLWQI